VRRFARRDEVTQAHHDARYARGIQLLEGVVEMLTKMM